MEQVPTHIAIIPDGNRRWANNRSMPAHLGHNFGSQAFDKILEESYKQKIAYLTFWIASLDNLTKRPPQEVEYLFELFEKRFIELRDNEIIHKEQVRVRVLGYLEHVAPPRLRKILHEIDVLTQQYNKFNLTFLMGYNGDLEMLMAIQAMIAARAPIDLEAPESEIRKYLLTGELPDVDLMIRTGGEPHNSAGFMMWHMKYAQLYFTKTLWPDFNPAEFKRALAEYSERTRRKGK